MSYNAFQSYFDKTKNKEQKQNTKTNKMSNGKIKNDNESVCCHDLTLTT